ncbi:hypothetical protein VYU27_008867 [Nannochloropsis oceanica]
MRLSTSILAATAALALVGAEELYSTSHNLRRVQGKAEVGRLDLGVSGSSGPSIAAGGVDFFLVSFSTDLPENVYNGWKITLKFDKSITMIQNLEADLLEQNADNTTLVFGPKEWNQDLKQGFQWQAWQGSCSGSPLTVLESYLTYDPTALPPSRPPPRPLHMEPPGVTVHEPVEGERFNLAKSLQLSMLFYEAQRSGRLPANKRVSWRFDSSLDDGKDVGLDLTGGYHDAGDHIKFIFPAAGATTLLAWGGLAFEEGYKASMEMGNLLDCVKWSTDYLMKLHTAKDEMYVQISDKPTDHFVFIRPEDMTLKRRSYKVTCANPGSQPVLESAAALAASHLLFKKHLKEGGKEGGVYDRKPAYDEEYVAELLRHAQELFDFGVRCPGHYVLDGKVPADCCYGGGPWEDEEAWAALWLYQATGTESYLEHAKRTYGKCCSPYKLQDPFNAWTQFGWDNKEAGVNLLLYSLTQEEQYKRAFTTHMDGWATADPIPRTPAGLSYVSQWGSLRVAANQAFLALIAAEAGLHPQSYRNYAKSQVYYILGDCCRNATTGEVMKTYQMGFGPVHPRNPHHRATACDLEGNCECSDRGSFHILYGAIVGGPREDDSHHDKCADFITNEVALDYSAGFQGAVAGLKQLSAQNILGDDR